MNLFCRRPGLAAADRPAVHPDHRDDLGAGAGQEALVGGVDVVRERQGLLRKRDAGRAGQLDDGVARDAFQDAGVVGGVQERAVLDEEDVVAGSTRRPRPCG